MLKKKSTTRNKTMHRPKLRKRKHQSGHV